MGRRIVNVPKRTPARRRPRTLPLTPDISAEFAEHIAAPNPHGMMRWLGNWTAGEYSQYDVVLDYPWLMIANKTTSDRAGPQPSGNPDWITDANGGIVFATSTIAEPLYITGQRYTFPGPALIQGYRFYVPSDTSTFSFEVWSAKNGSDMLQLVAPVLGDSIGWREIPTTVLVPTGTVIDLVTVVRAVTQPNTFTAQWSVENKNGDPDANKAWFQSNATEIRVHHTDAQGGDQQGNLEAVPAGAALIFAGLTWTITDTDHQGTHVRYTLTPNQGRPAEDDRQLTFQWGSTDPVPYAHDDNFFSGEPNVQGIVGPNLDNLVYNDTGYGVDMVVDWYTYSDDWDLMSYSDI